MAQLRTDSLTLAYDDREVIRDLSFTLPEGKVTIIVGANGSGKSTLLRGMSRLLTPKAGTVLLDGRSIHSLRSKDLARELGLLPQSPVAPEGVTVRDLVPRGRFPHQGLIPQWSAGDDEAVNEALALTGTAELRDRAVDELSGGQRQRVWIAMALAQRTDVLLLDEPTTYLDITHQIEVLDVVRRLNRERGVTVGIVLHDLNLAARYADHLVAVRNGAVYSEGDPSSVVTARMVHDVFGLTSRIVPDPAAGTPMVVPEVAGDESTAGAASPPAAPTTALEASTQLAVELEVVRTQRLSPSLIRITFTSDDLVHVGVPGHPLDVRIKLIVPHPQAPEGVDALASLRPGAAFDPEDDRDWYRNWLALDPEVRGWMRTYTLRAERAAGHPGNVSSGPEIDIDFVVHPVPDPAPGNGVASRWAESAQVGNRITILGPNRALVGNDYGGIAFRPGTARSILLVGDETALPAIASVLSALGPDFSGRALIEVPEAGDADRLPTASGIQVTWIAREGAVHGERLAAAVAGAMIERASCLTAESLGAAASEGVAANAALQAAVRYTGDSEGALELEDIDVDTSLLWETATGEGDFYAWIAGEAGMVKSLRRHLVSDLGIDRRQVSFMGYWRKGRPET